MGDIGYIIHIMYTYIGYDISIYEDSTTKEWLGLRMLRPIPSIGPLVRPDILVLLVDNVAEKTVLPIYQTHESIPTTWDHQNSKYSDQFVYVYIYIYI